MKLSGRRDKDYYIYLEDGVIREEQREGNEIKIMNEDSNSDFNNTNPNSPNNSNNPNVNSDFYDNLSKHIPSMPKKRVFNRILLISITVILLLLAVNVIGLFNAIQKDSSNQFELTTGSFGNVSKAKDELFFLADVIHNSNTHLKDYYDSLYTLAQKPNNNDLNKEISKIKDGINIDLQDANRLNQFVDEKGFNSPIQILINRFNNVNELADKLLSSPSSQYINLYNTYAEKEISFLKELTNSIQSYFEFFNIEYQVNDDNTFVYTKK